MNDNPWDTNVYWWCTRCGKSLYDYLNGCECWRAYSVKVVTTDTTTSKKDQPDDAEQMSRKEHGAIVRVLQEQNERLAEENAALRSEVDTLRELFGKLAQMNSDHLRAIETVLEEYRGDETEEADAEGEGAADGQAV